MRWAATQGFLQDTKPKAVEFFNKAAESFKKCKAKVRMGRSKGPAHIHQADWRARSLSSLSRSLSHTRAIQGRQLERSPV